MIPWKLIEMIYEDIRPLIPKVAKTVEGWKKDPNIFLSENLGFKIGWPKGWVGDKEIGETIRKQLGYPITISLPISILSEKMLLGLRPNVNVVVEIVGDIGIKSYIEQSLNVLKIHDIEVLNYHMDEHFNSATLELRQTSPLGVNIFQVQKYVIHDGKAYTITVSELHPEHMEKEPKLVDEIKDIVQSFSFVEK
jgi:hypothetical protein